VRELLRFRYLFEQMVRRELRQKYQGSVLGIAWYVVNPLVLMGAYYLMFGVALKPGFHHADYPLFLMVGIVVWIFFSQSLLSAAPSLLDQGSLIRKARFPRETIPGAVVTVQAVTFVFVLGLVTIVTLAIRGTVDVALLALPLAVVALYAFTLGLALTVSILHAYYRDVAPILSAMLLPWFFVSPVFFEPTDITQNQTAADALTWLNPVAPYIETVRSIVYSGSLPSAATCLYVVLAAVLTFVAGTTLFERLQRELAVVV
jgi:lipopolysaccharide transport system permease protein